MHIVKEFLESSTIHGLIYISSAGVSSQLMFLLSIVSSQTKSAKIVWLLVVCLGFIGAGILIGKSYIEWQENPIATSITTRPIDDLEFPKVTVCPPKDSNTALYHDLVKAGNRSLSDDERKTLRRASHQIFTEQAHKQYVKKMSALSQMGNILQVFQGFQSLPTPYNEEHGLKIKMRSLNGTITTPWFEKDYVDEFYQWDRDFLIVLDLPSDIKDLVGKGSLTINLEVDTREDQGWVEEVHLLPNFTLHTEKKYWPDAESHCQEEGGHLASVTSEEVNQALKSVAAGKNVWLGGRQVLGKWTWSDKSPWGFTSWERVSDNDCLRFLGGMWLTLPCNTYNTEFICQKNNILKGKRSIRLTYLKNQLNFSNFVVWYKYKTNQQLLDSWKDKRMTGLRLTWRIENENPPLFASISEVGRSIQTPRIGDTIGGTSASTSQNLYKVALTPKKDLSQQMANNRLVIDLTINKDLSDEVYAFTSFKLYSEKKSWTDADLHCKSEGGQLASIHSSWEQTMAEKAAEGGDRVWLGGRKVEGQWQWADNATWSYENWDYGKPKSQNYLLMSRGQWMDSWRSLSYYFLCQGTTVALTKNGLTSMEFSKEQLIFFPFYVLFKSQATVKSTSNTTSRKKGKSGFSLNWFLRSSNGTKLMNKMPARQGGWKRDLPPPAYKEPLLHDIVQLAKGLRLPNTTKENILMDVIHQRLQMIDMTQADHMCLMGQIKENEQSHIFSKIISNVKRGKVSGETSDKDILFGYDLFNAVMFCPPAIVSKTYKMFDQLLSVETSRTIIHTIISLFQSKVIKDDITFNLIRQFYLVLAKTLDLQYGNILLATSTTAQMKTVIWNKWPFFSNNTDLVKRCLQKSNCDTYQNLGNINFPFLSKFLLQLPIMSHESCRSIRST